MRIQTSILSTLIVAILAASSNAALTIDEGFNGKLNCIRDNTNPSDGACFLDMSYSAGVELAAALLAAQADYPTARLATPEEWDHMFMAAGISYDGTTTASQVFERGPSEIISSGANYDGGVLATTLGPTSVGLGIGDDVFIFSEPDGMSASTTTLDTMFIGGPNGHVFAQVQQQIEQPPFPTIGYLLVRPAVAVPEPSAFCCLGLVGLTIGFRNWLQARLLSRPTSLIDA